MGNRWLVCGTRNRFSKEIVFGELSRLSLVHGDPDLMIEGCCEFSPDKYAEQWAEKYGIAMEHHPAKAGKHLIRNLKMLDNATLVIAFWDGYSYGTAFTIAHAAMQKIPLVIIIAK